MNSLFNKKIIKWASITLTIAFLAGCLGLTKTLSAKAAAKNYSSAVLKISSKKSSSNESQKILLSIKNLASKGKIINCNFPVKSTCMSTVEKKWGKADKSNWVTQAKGLYSTYSKHKVVFGSNKGAQVFEVRSFDTCLGKISLSMVKKVFGSPLHDVKYNGKETIGYKAGNEFKILFVFKKPVKGSSNPILDHYSVFYPDGTINNMAGDPGREW